MNSGRFSFHQPRLSNRDLFQRCFGILIEREDNRDAMQHLNKLIKPFLLRRCKDQVLKTSAENQCHFSVELSAGTGIL